MIAFLVSVDAGAWREFGERRAQIYGYSYHYTKAGLYRVEDLPPSAEDQRPTWEPASWASVRKRLRPPQPGD